MKYRVIHDFCDLKDNTHLYREGDIYPRDGIEPPASRIEELKGTENRLGKPLIAEIEEVKKPAAKKPAVKKPAAKKPAVKKR